MPSKEIKELRQAGRLEEALTMAQAELEAQPDNIWGKRNISWVYYEYLKKYAHDFNYNDFVENLTKLKNLNLPESEVMVFDTTAWQVASLVFKIQKTEPVDYSKINQLFDIVKDFHFTKPSEAYSLLYKAFHKSYQNWSRYMEFADWWGFDNFRPEDYQKNNYNGRQIMALVEQAYIAYSKKILEGDTLNSFSLQRKIDVDKLNKFLPKLDSIILDHPEYQYPPYFKTKLLLVIGSQDKVLSAFLPFAKQKKNEFWVWELMAEIYNDNEDLKFACYCKALSLKSPKDFLIKIRQAFVNLLVKKEMFAEAKYEISQIVEIRNSHGWKISNQLNRWIEQEWYKKSVSKKTNDLYKLHLHKAEELLFQDVLEEVVAVEFVNNDKKMLNFIKDRNYKGFFSYKGLSLSPKIGDIIKVRLQPKGNEGYYQLLSVKSASDDEEKQCKAIKKVQAPIKIREGQKFGFVENIFVNPYLLKDSNLVDGEYVSCKAILTYNKKKDDWSWKAFSVVR